MKAILCKQWGPPGNLVVENVPTLKADKAHVIVNVKACGVNFPDTLIIQGKYQYKPDLPFSPGAEIAGIIKELGQGVSGVGVGDRVFAFIGWGGFAEEVLVPVEKIIHMPEGMEFKTASAFVMTYGTSYYALKHRAQLKSGETLLVLGAAGGVGLAAVELGKIMGARVIASASSDDKLAVCKEYGADELINYSTQNFRSIISKITNGQGVDVVCDPVGGSLSEQALRSTGWKGRFLVMGFASGEISKIPLNLPLLKGSSIVGVFWSDFIQREKEAYAHILQELTTWVVQGKLKPLVSRIYPLEQAALALNDLVRRRVKGKIVLVP
ncbi:MAG: NADPH:quinone oxidoreductase family protein [Betaproteobacteria bacterium]|nr:MAG: NADPH:quinone oxidoreductase family protein [Betaproteobacteria bacterium]